MKNRILTWLTILVVIGLISNFSLSLYKTYQAYLRLKDLEAEVLAGQAKNEDLKQVLGQRQNLAWVEEQARQQLYMTQEGETLVLIPAQPKTEDKGQVPASETKPNFFLWKELFFGP